MSDGDWLYSSRDWLIGYRGCACAVFALIGCWVEEITGCVWSSRDQSVIPAWSIQGFWREGLRRCLRHGLTLLANESQIQLRFCSSPQTLRKRYFSTCYTLSSQTIARPGYINFYSYPFTGEMALGVTNILLNSPSQWWGGKHTNKIQNIIA